jgi:mRNA interferase RelE/StbE
MGSRFQVFFARAAQKELRKLGPSAAAEILLQIEKKLTQDPEGYGERLSGALAGYYKLRVSGYRVVYSVQGERVWVVVLAAGKRNEGNVDNIYAWLTGEMLQERLDSVLREVDDPEDE